MARKRLKSRKSHITKNIVTGSLTQYKREEFKYMISNQLVDQLIPELLSFMDYDDFSQNGPYNIYSIYFDTADWQAFYSKMDGNLHRQKFRIRSYVPFPQTNENVFLEIKEKHNGTIFKRRSPVLMSEALDVSGGWKIEKQSPVIDEWRFNVMRNALKPRVLNTYSRLAFASEFYPGLRVTIDQDLQFCLLNEVDFETPTRRAYWTQGKSVIEIKFDRYVPHFIVDIIRRHNLQQVPVSKYCDSVISHFLLS